jgi:hypothetical protein
MQAHGAGYSASGRSRVGDVAAVANVATAASLIGTHVVRANDRFIVCNTMLSEGAAPVESLESGANSAKYWITDPPGIAWEAFHTLGSIPVYGE